MDRNREGLRLCLEAGVYAAKLLLWSCWVKDFSPQESLLVIHCRQLETRRNPLTTEVLAGEYLSLGHQFPLGGSSGSGEARFLGSPLSPLSYCFNSKDHRDTEH